MAYERGLKKPVAEVVDLATAGPKRKTIQVSSSIDPVGKYLVLALCDDGTLWRLSGLYEGKPEWEPFPVPPA